MTTADVNRDGKLDLVVADQGGGVSVLLNNGSGGLGAATSYAAGSEPQSVTTADVNGDGKPDLVVAGSGNGVTLGDVSVLLGKGDGSFNDAISYLAGTIPYFVTTADVNGDGKLDLVVADQGGSVSVLLNNGSGGFGAATSYAAGSNTFFVTTADVNGDGKLDLVAADAAGGVSVLLGNGSGQFGAAASYAAGSEPVSVRAADVNGDGTPDLVVADYLGGVSVLLGNGTGRFDTVASYDAGPDPNSVTTADVNGDGRLDLVVANFNGGVSVLLGDGLGGFGAATNYAAGLYPTSVTTSDVNGDGKPDLVVADIGGGVSVLLNANVVGITSIVATPSVSGPLNAGRTVTFVLTPAQAVAVTGTPVLTLNDGATATYDVATSTTTSLSFNYTVSAGQNATDLQVTGLTLNGAVIAVPDTLGFGVGTRYDAGMNPNSVTTADVNGDGKPDLIVANGPSNNMSVLLGDGHGTFGTAKNYAAGIFPDSVTTADVNGDGKLDLVVTDVDSVLILLGDGNGGFGAATSYTAGFNPSAVTTADVNGDGKLDLVVTNVASANVSVLLGKSGGGFDNAVNYGAGTAPTSVTTADLNGDGMLDLVVANGDSNDVSVLLGKSGGGFSTAVSYAVGSRPSSVTTADVNGDGKLDLIVADLNDGDVSVLIGDGSGSFATAVKYAAGINPTSVTTADMNLDGKLDLVVSDFNGGVLVLLGDGTGKFAKAISYATPQSQNESVTTADVNGDGKPDIVVAAANSGVSVLLNSSTAPGIFDVASAATASGHDTGLTVYTTTPTVTSDTAAPSSGDFTVGKIVGFTVALSQTVFVTGTPTLTLNDGGIASYVSGSGTSTLVFGTTIAAGQNAATLAVTGESLPGGATVRDAAGNDAVLTGANTMFTGLMVDTAVPVVSSVTLTVAENAGATPIGLSAPTDASPVTITVTAVPSDGLVTLANGTTAVTANEVLTAAQLTGLTFAPTAGLFGQTSMLTYRVVDAAGNASTGTAVLTIGAPGAPTISGTMAGQLVTDAATVRPFAGVTVADPNAGQTEAVTVTPSTTADGTLSDPNAATDGSTIVNGVLSVGGTAAQVTAALKGLVFVPVAHQVAPGQTVTTGFTIGASDTAGKAASDAFTTVVATAANDAPVLGGTVAGQAGTFGFAVAPFSSVTITDPDQGASETVTVTLLAGNVASDATGTLSGPGLTRTAAGTYGLAAGSPAAEQAALRALVFTPTAVGGTTGLALSVSDGIAPAPTVDTVTSVIVPPFPAPVFATPSEIVNGPPSLTGMAPPNTAVTVFANGTAVGSAAADATGGFALAPALPLGADVLTATATSGGVTSAVSAPLAVLAVPGPVNGITTSDVSSNVIAAALASGARLAFVSGTEAIVLTDGTLSVGPDTGEATIQRLYEGLLNRGGEAFGLGHWDGVLASAGKVAVAAGFLASPEYAAVHGQQTDQQFVDGLYQGLLHRSSAGDPGSGTWTGQLAGGISRAAVAVGIADSAEAKAVQAAATAQVYAPNAASLLVHELFETGLGREVDLTGLPFFTAELATMTSTQVAAQIAGSAEFLSDHAAQGNADFVTSLYESGLGRAPDAGSAAWTSLLDGGGSRAAVLLGIATSPEATGRLTGQLTG